MALCGLEETQTDNKNFNIIGPPEEYDNGHTPPTRLTQIKRPSVWSELFFFALQRIVNIIQGSGLRRRVGNAKTKTAAVFY